MTTATIALQTTKIGAEVQDGVGWLKFNNPERHNAVSLEMWQGMADAAAAFEANADVRVVVMYGAGGKSFVSGADLGEFEQRRSNAGQKRQYDEVLLRGQLGLAQLSKPLIAMIRGYCIGGGLAIALNADIRFGTPDSRYGIPAAKLGVGYEYRDLATLARLVGPSCAKDIVFSARLIESEEALRIGLVNFVVDDAQLESQVRDYARRIVANAPLTMHAAKASLAAFERDSLDAETVKKLTGLIDRCFDSEDFKEGRSAFSEKRAPRFRGC